ncbi:unnamed protein product, partial [Symbiodinium sp. CCMP2592]
VDDSKLDELGIGAEGKLVIKLGVMCQLVEYDSTDVQDILMHQGVQHDAESASNKFKQTSLQSKFDIIVAAQGRVPGGAMEEAVKLLVKQFGVSKKGTFWRWAHMRQVLPEEVFDNRYLCGVGEAAKYRLGPGWALAAFQLLLDHLDGQVLQVTTAQFSNDFCRPLKAAEVWVKQQLSAHRKIAESSGSFQCPSLQLRVTAWLQSDKGRKAVLKCLGEKVPINSMEELKRMAEQLKEMAKAGATVSESTSSSPPVSGEPAAAGEAAEIGEDVDTSVNVEMQDAPAKIDPQLEQAEREATADLVKCTVHFERRDWVEELKLHVFAGSKTIAVVDSPTSKVKHVLDELNFMSDAIKNHMHPETVNVIVPVGKRLDLLSMVAQKAELLFPKRKVFTLAVTAGESQTLKRVPNYIVYIPGPASKENVPVLVKANSVKASTWEGLRLVCKSRTCSHRDAPANKDEADLHEEISPEDMDEDCDADMDIQEDEDEVVMMEDVVEEGGSAKKKKDYTVALWPFAKPIQHWKIILDQVAHASSAKYLVCISRQMVTQRFLVEARKQQGVKRAASRGGLSFIGATVPDGEMTIVKEVSLDGAAWPSGLNSWPENLQDRCVELLHKELGQCDLALVDTKFGKGLETTRSYRDGDIICHASALWFDDLNLLKKFLAQPGHSVLLDRLIRVDNMPITADETATLYGALVGAASYLQHYLGLSKRGANVELVPMCGNGLSSTLVAVRVRTRNHTGISSRTLLCLNYGMDYDFSVGQDGAEDEAEAKRFKGRLDQLFKQQQQCQSGDDDKQKDAATTDQPVDTKDGQQGSGQAQGQGGNYMTILKSLEIFNFGMIHGDNNDIKLILTAKDDAKGNKKVSPNSVLLFVGNGNIKKNKDGNTSGNMLYMFPKADKCSVIFALKVTKKDSDGKEKHIDYVADLDKVETLSALITRKKAKEVVNAGTFPPGVPPVSLGSKDMFFEPTEENAKLVVYPS